MLVYHGTTIVVKKPLVDYSKRNLDFGIGFYVTQNRDLAEKWARRKKDFIGANNSILNVYDLNDKYVNCKYLKFDVMNKSWLDFVCDCRKGLDIYKNYDVIEGAIANDKVFSAVDFYRKGIWDSLRTIKELSFFENAYQICFINQEIMNVYLKYCDSVEV